MNKTRCLIFPCGSEIGLEINRALQNSIHFEMYGASSVSDHGEFVYKNYIGELPFINSPRFIDKLNNIIEKYKIDYIFPAHDSAVLKLAKNKNKIKANIVTSPYKTCEICRSKIKTYKKLVNIIKTPKIYNIDDEIDFPVFIKPDVGQGSKGAKKVNSKEELFVEYKKNPSIVISEFLPNQEYTVDCFTNRDGKLLFAGGRERLRITNGICVKSKPIYNEQFIEIAEKINKVLKFRGVWFFQLKKDKNHELSLLEVAPRIAGTMGLYRGLGINFTQLSLFDAMGYDVKVEQSAFDIQLDRALYAAFKTNIQYNTIYVDLDDTLVIENKVNTDLIKFLYQAKNENKRIIIISKHESDIKNTLKKHYISEALFDEIIHLKKEDKKSKYIKHKNAIFIDDSFQERCEVFYERKIAVFGVENIEVLFNWRK